MNLLCYLTNLERATDGLELVRRWRGLLIETLVSTFADHSRYCLAKMYVYLEDIGCFEAESPSSGMIVVEMVATMALDTVEPGKAKI